MCVLLSFNLYINLIKVKIKRLPQNTRQYMGQAIKKKKLIACSLYFASFLFSNKKGKKIVEQKAKLYS